MIAVKEHCQWALEVCAQDPQQPNFALSGVPTQDTRESLSKVSSFIVKRADVEENSNFIFLIGIRRDKAVLRRMNKQI